MDKQKAYYRKLRRRLVYQQVNKLHRKLWLDHRSEKHIQLIAVMFFCGIILVITIGMRTLVSWIVISRIYAGLAVAFSLIPLKFYPLIYRLRKEMKVLFSVFGIGPFLTGLILTINFLFSTASWNEIYTVESINYYPSDHLFEVKLEQNALHIRQELRRFSSDKNMTAPEKVEYQFDQGIFGMKTVMKSHLISSSDSGTVTK